MIEKLLLDSSKTYLNSNMYGVYCMELKEKIIKTLKDLGKMPTTRIAAIVGMNGDRAKEALEELLEEKKVNRIEETLATYWEIK